MKLILLGVCLAAPWSRGAPEPEGEPKVIAPVVVTATRTPNEVSRVAVTTQVLTMTQLREMPVTTIDSALRSVPSFSLFRRSDSLTTHPTAQGVSLRGLGPSGASRSLVLLDGVPLNDAFGGWVAWTKIPRDAVDRIEVVPGGGASAWGNAALGGVVQAFLPAFSPARDAQAATRVTACAGDFGTRSFGVVMTRPMAKGAVQLLGESFVTSGFPLIASESRGPVDVAAWNRHRSLTARARWPLGQNADITGTVRRFEEKRGNGTPLQRNDTRETFASLDVAGQSGQALTWRMTAYVQDQTFASTFTAINAVRTMETLASDQFAVPATAAGASGNAVWRQADDRRTTVGLDTRTVRGETRENYAFTGGAFTRQRAAGGKQATVGAYALHERAVHETLRVTGGGRVDWWSDRDGLRRETDRVTGASLRHEHFEARDGFEVSPSLGLIWAPANAWRIRGHAQRAFRQPTLNERYRPFRQGPNVTEANPGLGTESVTSAELGAEWTLTGPGFAKIEAMNERSSAAAAGVATLSAACFWNDLRNAVTNVTLARGPGVFALFGSLPSGGTGRQRLNVDHITVRGFEGTAKWQVAKTFGVSGSYLYNDAVVAQATVAPALDGRRLPQVPRHAAVAGLTWDAATRVRLTARVRWLGRQFEDDENSLRLGAVVVADVGVTVPLNRHLEAFVSIENAGDARVETARTIDGVVSTGTPRFAWGGIRGRW